MSTRTDTQEINKNIGKILVAIESLDARVGRLEVRIDRLEARVGKVEDKLDDLNTRFCAFEKETKDNFRYLIGIIDVGFQQMATKEDLSDLREEMIERMDFKTDALQFQINDLKGTMEARFDRLDEKLDSFATWAKSILSNHEHRLVSVEKVAFP